MERINRWYLLVILACGLSLLFLQGQGRNCIDDDLDGFYIPTCGSECGPLDCDDANPNVSPGAREGTAGDPTCSDGIDNDCDGAIDDLDSGCDLPTMRSLPDTGIELCYDMSQEIDCPAPGEPFYGQDAQYTTNPMSFTDNVDGTVTDNVTGLMWQEEDDDAAKPWRDAFAYCDYLELAGHTNWRLPNEYEIQGIVDYGQQERPSIDAAYFPDLKPSYYWSSSIYTGSTDSAWRVYYLGNVNYNEITNSMYVLCVRDEPTLQSFTDNGNGTVTDNVTGLLWQQEVDGVEMDWEDALAYCEDSELAGRTDWRLPDIKELRSIVDNTQYDPAVDTAYFPGTAWYYHWSSSTYADYTGSAWYVNITNGGAYYTYKTKTQYKYVRCVR